VHDSLRAAPIIHMYMYVYIVSEQLQSYTCCLQSGKACSLHTKATRTYKHGTGHVLTGLTCEAQSAVCHCCCNHEPLLDKPLLYQHCIVATATSSACQPDLWLQQHAHVDCRGCTVGCWGWSCCSWSSCSCCSR
jgi:hypothetical protein